MRWRWALGILVAAIPTPCLVASTEGLPPPIVTQQTYFALPFHIEPADQPECEPVEVQLFVSADRGQHWEFAASVEPSDGRFLFRAPGEGEYWFALRTLDRAGRSHPPWNVGPGLRVVVDTSPPRLVLRAHREPEGQILAIAEVAEPHPRPDSLEIQFRAAPEGSWQPVAPAVADEPSGRRCAAWTPPAGTTRVEVRAEAADRAGNRSVQHAQVELQAPSGVATLARAHPPGLPTAAEVLPRWQTPWIESPSSGWPLGAPAASDSQTPGED